MTWWSNACRLCHGSVQQGVNSAVILGDWSLWRHRNDCVFNGVQPSVATVLQLAREEARVWCMDGAKGLSLVSATGLGG
uniref:Uncharacterized protein n=1 Tax=Arundo donax TaxID=35708 RepID=A0A0A8ZV08_ARUDO